MNHSILATLAGWLVATGNGQKARWRCAVSAWIMGPHRSDTMTRLFGLELTNWTIFKCAPLFPFLGRNEMSHRFSFFTRLRCNLFSNGLSFRWRTMMAGVAIKILIGSRQRNCRAPGNWFVYGCRDGLDEEGRLGTLSDMMPAGVLSSLTMIQTTAGQIKMIATNLVFASRL